MKCRLKKCPRCSGGLREELNTSGVIEEPLVRAEELQHRAAHGGGRRPVG
jgi:hypothetical protein